ncbi:glycogen synthase GlgA [bacterium]|nr:glycogen synthase GlgA [bacterium]
MVASEMDPFAKTGGLADVVGSLPKALQELGHDVRVIIPYYRCVREGDFPTRAFPDPLDTIMGSSIEWCAIRVFEGPSAFPIYFVEHDHYFDREGIYHDHSLRDYGDNPLRFGFLCKIALRLCAYLSFEPDIIHIHDWPTALIAAYLKTWAWNDPAVGQAASLLTIHNMSYQGIYPKNLIPTLGLSWEHFNANQFESYDQLNMLKGGISFADMVNTVSPTYSFEVRQLNHSAGLSSQLYRKGANFTGVLNGVDYETWSPETDPFIPSHYSRDDLRGKKVCKRELQKLFRLVRDPEVPLIGAIGRFVEQKGFHLIARVIDGILRNMKIQFIILGTGENSLEHFFGDLPQHYPGRAASYIGFSNELAHLIEAGADLFLMPSLFEPCGLNQIYSLRYGTLPIVHATGGLEDTVRNYNESHGHGTGFKFYDSTPAALYNTVGWAVSTYFDRKHHFKQLIRNAMSQDFSWQTSAREYEKLYIRAIMNITLFPR